MPESVIQDSNEEQRLMKYEVIESRTYPGHWNVEAIDQEGRVFVVIFSGPNASGRAYEYAAWKNSVYAPAEKAQLVPALA
jgi:hypothetical protein